MQLTCSLTPLEYDIVSLGFLQEIPQLQTCSGSVFNKHSQWYTMYIAMHGIMYAEIYSLEVRETAIQIC